MLKVKLHTTYVESTISMPQSMSCSEPDSLAKNIGAPRSLSHVSTLQHANDTATDPALTEPQSSSPQRECSPFQVPASPKAGSQKSCRASSFVWADTATQLTMSKRPGNRTRAPRKCNSQHMVGSCKGEHGISPKSMSLRDARRTPVPAIGSEQNRSYSSREAQLEQMDKSKSLPLYISETVRVSQKGSRREEIEQDVHACHPDRRDSAPQIPDVVPQGGPMSPLSDGAASDSESETETENRLRAALEFLLFPPEHSNADDSRRALNQVRRSLRSGTTCPSRRLERFLREIYRAMDDFEEDHQVQERACVVLGKIARDMPSAQPSIAETGGVKQIMRAIQRYKKLDTLQDKGIFAILSLTGDAEARNSILEERGAECVLWAMGEFQDVRTILKNGSTTLCNLAFASEVGKERIGRVGGIDAIVNAMNRHETDVDLQTCCCLALRNITFGSRTNQWIAGRACALDSIVRLMKNFQKDINVQYQGCWALANICSNDSGNKDRAGDGDLIAVCMTAMEDNIDETHVVEQSLAVLSNISDQNLENQVRIGKAGGPRLIFKVLHKYRHNPKIVRRGCSAIRFLCFSKQNRDETYEFGGLKLLTRILGDAEDIADVAESAILALGNAICDHKEGKRLVARYGGIATIADVMSKHLDQERIQEYCVLALRNLSDSDEVNSRLLGDSGAIDMAIYAMMGYPKNAQIQEHSCAMMFNIAFSDHNLRIMKDLAVANVVEYAKECHNQSPDIKFQALALLQILRSGEEPTSLTGIPSMRKLKSSASRRKCP